MNKKLNKEIIDNLLDRQIKLQEKINEYANKVKEILVSKKRKIKDLEIEEKKLKSYSKSIKIFEEIRRCVKRVRV